MLNMLTRCTSVSRDNLSDTRDGRRESEAVIHGIFVFMFFYFSVLCVGMIHGSFIFLYA